MRKGIKTEPYLSNFSKTEALCGNAIHTFLEQHQAQNSEHKADDWGCRLSCSNKVLVPSKTNILQDHWQTSPYHCLPMLGANQISQKQKAYQAFSGK